MSEDTVLAFTPAHRLREMVSRKEVSPVELAELFLRRIEAVNPKINAFLTVTADMALAQARMAEQAVARGDTLGPLHGIPISLKDTLPTKGIRTTMGTEALKDWVPDWDELVTERLRDAGAIVLGKTNVSELGLIGSGENRLGDEVRNPWDVRRVTGGSSAGGAASVAAGLNPIAQGADGGGSIRTPAAFCGVFGLKPTQGHVAHRARSLNNWIPYVINQEGPLTNSVRDAAVFLQVIAGPDRDDPYCLKEEPPDFLGSLNMGVEGLRVAWSEDFGSIAVDPEVVEVTKRAAHVFVDMDATMVESPVHMDIMALHRISRTLSDVAAYLSYNHLLDKWRDRMMPQAVEIIERGRTIPGSQYATALAQLEQHRRWFAKRFEQFDILLSPVQSVPAFLCGQIPKVVNGRDVSALGFRSYYPFTFPINMTGNPAASIPCGFSREGLPIGLHVIGRKAEEATLLRACAAFEKARPWTGRHPPL